MNKVVRNRYRSPRNRLQLSSIGRPAWSKVTACVHNSGPRANVQHRCLIGIRGNGLDIVVGSGWDYPGRAELVVKDVWEKPVLMRAGATATGSG